MSKPFVTLQDAEGNYVGIRVDTIWKIKYSNYKGRVALHYTANQSLTHVITIDLNENREWLESVGFVVPVDSDAVAQTDTPLGVPTDDMPDEPQHETNVIEWADKMICDGDFLVLDTETTGLDGYPIEVSVINAAGDVLFDKRIKPPAGQTIHPKAEAVHGISLDDLADAPEWDAVRDEFKKIVDGKKIIIYNAGFDLGIIRNVENAYKLDKKFGWIPECAMMEYAEYNGDWNEYHGNYRWVKLTDAARAMGVPVSDAHSALGDCRMTLGVIQALAAKARSDKPVNNGEIPF